MFHKADRSFDGLLEVDLSQRIEVGKEPLHRLLEVVLARNLRSTLEWLTQKDE